MILEMRESILIAIVIIFIYIFYYIKKDRLTLVEANNNVKYMVYNDRNKGDSANKLAELIERMYKVKNYLVNNIDKYPEYKEYIILLRDNFNEQKTSIYENAPDSNLTSYSVNKGEELAFCLKSKKTGQLHDINLLMYVALHEMSHIACPEVGHGDLFKKIFRFITKEAIKIDLYKEDDYGKNPTEYCGMTLSSTIL
jgi:hypothetical protein